MYSSEANRLSHQLELSKVEFLDSAKIVTLKARVGQLMQSNGIEELSAKGMKKLESCLNVDDLKLLREIASSLKTSTREVLFDYVRMNL